MCCDNSYDTHELRVQNMSMMVTSTAVLIAMLFVSALLPTLLVRYLYAGQQLFEQPVLLEYIPIVSFAIGFGYFLLAVIGNAMRAKRIKYMNKQADMDSCCGSSCCDDDDMMEELESLAEAITKETKKPAKKKPAPKKAAPKAKPKK